MEYVLKNIIICAYTCLMLIILPTCTDDNGGPEQGDNFLDMLPKASQLDSCTLNDTTVTYDKNSLYNLIDGYDIFYLSRGFIRGATQGYLYSNPKLVRQKNFDYLFCEMIQPDSAKSIYKASLELADTAQLITGISGGAAIITQGSWNYECMMYKNRYFIKFDGVYYDTTSGAQEAIKAKFTEFCGVFDENINSNLVFGP